MTGRPLAARIYDLIEYIEENIFKDGTRRKKNDPLADKARVLRETKLIPKLIFRIESYNKFIILLGKKTKEDLSEYLHIGTVRDFRIKTSALRDVLNKSIADSNDTEIDESQLDEAECESDASSSVDEPDVTEEQSDTGSAVPMGRLSCSSTTSSNVLNELEHCDVTDPSVAIQNLAKINERTKRKLAKKKGSNDVEEETGRPLSKRARKQPVKIVTKSLGSALERASKHAGKKSGKDL